MEYTLPDDLIALSGSMHIATDCIDILVKRGSIYPLDIDHVDKDLVEVSTCLERVNRHFVIMRAAQHANSHG